MYCCIYTSKHILIFVYFVLFHNDVLVEGILVIGSKHNLKPRGPIIPSLAIGSSAFEGRGLPTGQLMYTVNSNAL